MAEPKLYVIATPLGNRGDITLRALETLKELTHLFAEDTRELAKLLTLYDIPAQGKKLHSYAAHNLQRATELGVEILNEGHSIGLVTDRGTPAISDPGSLLVEQARKAGYGVVPVPGATSIAAAFSVSGIEPGPFSFVGFLPRKEKQCQDLFKVLAQVGWPTIFFESPKRIRETVGFMKTYFPEGNLFLAREMTKVFETFTWHQLSELNLDLVEERGEYVGVLLPGPVPQTAQPWETEVDYRCRSDKEWAKWVASRTGVGASDIYNALQQRKRDQL